LFLLELHQISANFNKFWEVDGKVAAIVCCHVTTLPCEIQMF